MAWIQYYTIKPYIFYSLAFIPQWTRHFAVLFKRTVYVIENKWSKVTYQADKLSGRFERFYTTFIHNITVCKTYGAHK